MAGGVASIGPGTGSYAYSAGTATSAGKEVERDFAGLSALASCFAFVGSALTTLVSDSTGYTNIYLIKLL